MSLRIDLALVEETAKLLYIRALKLLPAPSRRRVVAAKRATNGKWKPTAWTPWLWVK